jgi:hypothetical protein
MLFCYFEAPQRLSKKDGHSQCRSLWAQARWVGKTTVNQQSIEYFRTRERIERAAAKAAATEAARRAHLELAESYAALVQKG